MKIYMKYLLTYIFLVKHRWVDAKIVQKNYILFEIIKTFFFKTHIILIKDSLKFNSNSEF